MNDINTLYGGRIRVRVCGILRDHHRVLLLNHRMLNEDHIFWNFPGGGLEEGEDIIRALQREFREETHLEVSVHELVYLNQHISGKLHGVELYFRVSTLNLAPELGSDPEGNILAELRWFTEEDLAQLQPGHCPPFLRNIAFQDHE
ncbi:MAG: NUDIX hydrolase [Leadbetterella sp.]|nr:NUDIX hydrolase [Leadbetterella sp.]